MRDLDDFLPEINTKAPGCPAPAAYLAILQAADEFCTKTKLWRDVSTAPVNNTGEIDFDVPDQAVLIDFESVKFGDDDLMPKDIGWLDKYMRGWRRGALDGIPRYYAQIEVGQLIVTPIDTGILTITSILKPSMDADELPDFLYEQYHELIAYGALGRLLQTPDQPFTNVQMGVAYMAAFEQKLGGLQWKEAKGQQRAPLRQRGQYM